MISRLRNLGIRISFLLTFLLTLGLCACSAGGGGGLPGGGLGGNAAAPTQEAGAAAPGVEIFAGEFILVHNQVQPTGAPGGDGSVPINLKGQLTDKLGNPFPKFTPGRYVRIYEPTKRQFLDKLIQEGNVFEANLTVLPTAYNPATQKTVGWCFFAVPANYSGTLENDPKPCPLGPPDCFELNNTWIDFLNENYIDDPCPLLNK